MRGMARMTVEIVEFTLRWTLAELAMLHFGPAEPEALMIRERAAVLDHLDAGLFEALGRGFVPDPELHPHDLRAG